MSTVIELGRVRRARSVSGVEGGVRWLDPASRVSRSLRSVCQFVSVPLCPLPTFPLRTRTRTHTHTRTHRDCSRSARAAVAELANDVRALSLVNVRMCECVSV